MNTAIRQLTPVSVVSRPLRVPIPEDVSPISHWCHRQERLQMCRGWDIDDVFLLPLERDLVFRPAVCRASLP